MRRIACAFGANIDLHNYLLIRLHLHIMCEHRLPFTANITPLGISLAPLAQISICLLSPHPPPTRRRSPAPRRSRPLFVTLSACHLSRYRESLPHKDCSFGRNRAKVGCCPSLHQAIHSKLNNKTICGYGEIGRRFRLRFLWVKHIVWVRVPLSAP